jgi:DnaJ-class molecular chaperone
MTKIKKIICPRCTGNGYVRIPNKAVGFDKQVVAQCTMCDSQGEINEVDRPSDGFNFDYSGIDADKLQ